MEQPYASPLLHYAKSAPLTKITQEYSAAVQNANVAQALEQVNVERPDPRDQDGPSQRQELRQ